VFCAILISPLLPLQKIEFPALTNVLEGYSYRLLSTQVVPSLTNTTSSIIQKYQASVAAAAIPTSQSSMYHTSASVEGYITGQFVVSLLKRLDWSSNITPTSISATIIDVSNFTIQDVSLGPFALACNQGLRQVYFSSRNLQTQSLTAWFPLVTCAI